MTKAFQDVPRRKKRCFLTHVALICDRTDIQPLLPQVIVANERTMPLGMMAELRAAAPANVYLVRQTSSWNNSDLCRRIVRWIALALQGFRDTLQPVLLFDAVRIHSTPEVLQECWRCNIWPVLVPARTTWLLQPLDTHGFRPFKAQLRESYQEGRVAAGASDLDIRLFLPCLYESIRLILQGRRWAGAFAADGFCQGQGHVCESVRRELQLGGGGPLQLPSSRPTLEQLQSCFPRRARIPLELLWRAFDGPASSVAPAGPLAGGAPRRPVEEVPALMLGRTRADHRRAEAAEASQAAVVSADAAEAVAVRPLIARGRRLPWARARATAEELS